MTINKLAIIGGSGLYDVEEFKNRELLDLDTPWGKPSDQILKTNYNNKDVYFLPRHGRGHFISPSNINFRANIDALKQLGVTDIVSVSAVGSLKENLPPGKFVIVDQFIDRTFARVKTFFDEEIVAHVSMAHPTSNGLMNACEEAIKKEKIEYQRSGTYVVMEGPQFSTLAESNLYRSWNADVIGMTNMPEAKLAREAEIRYASVSMVTDYDCWHPDHENVDVQQVVKVLLGNAAKAKNMIKNLIENFENHIDPKDPTNNCLDVAIITAPEKRTKKTIEKLKERCNVVIIRGNEGYDFGSWMTGLRFCDEAIKNRDEIIITNDSLWGPIMPLDTLFNRIRACEADAVGLTDDLMYSYHLQSSFLVFRKSVITSRTFADFWSQQQVWSKKRDLVKACEVGLSTALIKDGFNIQSLYSNQSNGNILHFKWRQLIEDQDFPFLKVSLLRDNPTEQDISEWIQVIKPRNSPLCDQIKEQLSEQ